MLRRKVTERFLEWRTLHKALLVTGARQIGKNLLLKQQNL